jgi:DNA ligase-1
MTKPMLAVDADESKINFPCIIQPKIDGVRGLNMEGVLTGRSLKQHKNRHTTKFFSHYLLQGLDGELTFCENPVAEDLCRKTSSVLGTIEGTPRLKWWLFDYITVYSKILPYKVRYELLKEKVALLKTQHPLLSPHIELIPSFECVSLNDLLTFEEDFLELGYEGVIIRDPNGKHKQGRSTIREGGLLRIKRFIEEEAVVVGVVEGETNNNEAQKNELGQTFRTSHAENKTSNGMIGSLTCKVIKDVFDPQTKKLLFKRDTLITVSPGKMTHEERAHYFINQHLILGEVIKYKFFPKGIKSLPRFPTFISFRNIEDL